MRHVSEETLDLYRGPGRCENCGAYSGHREPHHVLAKGVGSGKRLDLALNLVALGPAFSCQCHRDVQGRVPLGARLVGRREGLDAGFVERRLWELVRAPKSCKPCWRCWGAGSVRVGRCWGFRRHPCVCGGGILGPDGEPWVEPERRMTWQR